MTELRSRNTNRWVVGSVFGLVVAYPLAVVGQENNAKEAKTRAANDKYAPVLATVTHRTVRLQPNGRFSGRLRRVDALSGQPFAVPGVSVYLIQNRRIMYRTSLDEDGRFEFNRVQHGVYSLVAAGSSGFASFPIQVFPMDQGAARKASADRFSSAPLSQTNQPLATLRQTLERTSPRVFTFASQADNTPSQNRTEAKLDDQVLSTNDQDIRQIATQDVPAVEELEAYLIDPRDLSAVADFLQRFVPPASGPPVAPGGFGGGAPSGGGSGGGGGGGGSDGFGLATGLLPVLLGTAGAAGNRGGGRSSSGFTGRGPVTPTPPAQVPPPFPDFPPDLPPPPDPNPPPLISELKP